MKILSICGSPRKGSSETILLKLQELLKAKGVKNEIILLREKKINRCLGCVEYCNKNLKCHQQDDMDLIMDKMESADGFIFISPNYFKMPTGLFKDFIDRTSIFFTAGKGKLFHSKRAAVIGVGTDETKFIDVCVNNIADNYCGDLEVNVVARKSFRTHSELKGNYNDVFESGLNPTINEDLEEITNKLIANK